MNRWLWPALLLITAGALALRFPALDQRPMHADESVHAVKFLGLWHDGVYRYDPNEYHGPSLYYATLPLAWLSSARLPSELSDATLRLVPVCFGVGLILLLAFLADGLGRPAVLFAGLFTAVSPAMVFYSRYYIHEMLLVFFTLLFLVSAWRYSQSGRLAWALAAGTGLGLMHATKETFVFSIVAMAAAIVFCRLLDRWHLAGHERATPFFWRSSDLVLGAVAALAVSVVLFSSFFSNWAGPLDSLRTYLPWLSRAGGQSPHVHPWSFYFERLLFFHPAKGLVWTEAWVVLLALVGMAAGFTRKGLGDADPRLVRFLAFYTITLTMAYCALAYKTPWCLLGFYHGMILLAGIGAAVLLRLAKPPLLRPVYVLFMLAACGHLVCQAWWATHSYASDRRNPYVYAHTSSDLLRLVERVRAVAKSASSQNETQINVITPNGDYWPLPWYLRQFKRVGWWDHLESNPYAPIMIVGTKLGADLDERSNKKWLMTGMFELRPKVFLELYVEYGLWKRYLETRPPPKDEE